MIRWTFADLKLANLQIIWQFLFVSLRIFASLCLIRPGSIMASRLLDRLKRSLFKEGQGAGPEQEAAGEQEEEELRNDHWEAELEEEEECVTEKLGGTLCFDSEGGTEDGPEGEGSGLDSDSDFLGESMEEELSSTGERDVFCPLNLELLSEEN